MDKIKCFIDCYVPVYKCNFKCEYCFISTMENYNQNKSTKKIEYDPKLIRKALSIDRWGGHLMLNFCAAGETMLCTELLDIIKELLEEGHYCMIVTNGTITAKFKELANLPLELRERLFIKFSYHYLELKKRNLLDVFFDNVKLMKKNGISFTVEVTPSDDYIPYIDEIKSTCIENIGAMPHITVCRIENGDVPLMTKLNKEEFISKWNEFDSQLFNFKIRIFGEKRTEFCYAGAWSYTLDLCTGNLSQCYRGKCLQNIYKDDLPIKKCPVGCNCFDAHCWNGHAFLGFGDIPELQSPTFESERNRETEDGPWITEKMAYFMKSKLYECNEQYNEHEKEEANKKSKKFVQKQEIYTKIKRIIKGVLKK